MSSNFRSEQVSVLLLFVVQNGPVQNGYLNEEAEKPTLNREVVAETIEEAAAVIVECAMNGAMHVAMSQPPGAGAGGGTRRRAAAYASPDSAVNFTNGVGRDVVEMDPSEVNGSTTTETSALSEVMEQAAAAADRSAEELAQDNEQLVDVTSAAFAQREEAQGAAGDAREVADAQDTPVRASVCGLRFNFWSMESHFVGNLCSVLHESGQAEKRCA